MLGIGLPMTAAHISSIPLTFGTPRIEEDSNANLSPNRYKQRKDPWLGVTQWTAVGDTAFWGNITIMIRGSALGAKKGSKYFHAGTGTGHMVDSNAKIRVAVK
ncbi:MAG: hypothetical protein EOO27_35790 [Comamonadaceae bacterium]|nr:MAG: hypothetical protein EOO27_35790 [Comamonadaceae bacterium]